MKITIKPNKQANKKAGRGFPIIIYATMNYKENEWRTGFYSEVSAWNEQRAAPKRNKIKNY